MNDITKQMEPHSNDDEINLLDLLVVIAENLKLLLVGPIVAGFLMFGISHFLPQKFTSQAILGLPATTNSPVATLAPQAAVMMTSPLVLDPVIESLHLAGTDTIQVARTALASRIDAKVTKDGLLRLDVSASSAAQAQTIANAIIDTWLKSTVPGEQDRADLEKRLAFAQTSLKSVNKLVESLANDGATSLVKPLTRADAAASIVAMGELQARYLAEVISIPRALQGLTRDVVKQPPTLPTEPVAPNKGLMAAFAALGSGVVLLLWVFLRQTWKNAALQPQGAQKVSRLRAALWLKA